MVIGLKYQAEIDKRSLSIECPQSVIPSDNLHAFRFVYNPIENGMNFLPNIVFDKHMGIGFNYDNAREDVICSRCGTSMYDTLTNAKKAWKKLGPRVKEKLGYTHVANGILGKNDGVMKQIQHDGHFGFYEAVNANLVDKFTIIETL